MSEYELPDRYPDEWEDIKQKVHKRDNWECQNPTCSAKASKKGGSSKVHCDHITPLSQGGTHELDNLQTLCESCHNMKTKIETGGYFSEEPGREGGHEPPSGILDLGEQPYSEIPTHKAAFGYFPSLATFFGGGLLLMIGTAGLALPVAGVLFFLPLILVFGCLSRIIREEVVRSHQDLSSYKPVKMRLLSGIHNRREGVRFAAIFYATPFAALSTLYLTVVVDTSAIFELLLLITSLALIFACPLVIFFGVASAQKSAVDGSETTLRETIRDPRVRRQAPKGYVLGLFAAMGIWILGSVSAYIPILGIAVFFYIFVTGVILYSRMVGKMVTLPRSHS